MGKGYAEGPAAEEAERRLEQDAEGLLDAPADRQAVFGSTEENRDRHFLGWLDDVDPDELFERGEAWGLTIVRTRADDSP